MENQENQIKKESKFVTCFRLARETRKAQKAYFECGRTTTQLVVSKECEKALDIVIAQIEKEAKQKGMEL